MCTSPNCGVRVLDPETGAIIVKFLGAAKQFRPDSFNGDGIGSLVRFPCGQCMECRISKAREWSIRCIHEGYMHREMCFLTLTYDNDHLPDNGSLCKKHLQDFLKSYRRYLDYHFNKKIRFFASGEYGSKSFRPHYHLLIFGDDFSEDRRFYKIGKSGDKYFRSPTLESLWPYGFSVIGSVTYDSVFYVAKYTTKKIKGDLARYSYDGVEPEFAQMSRRPGIGHDFLIKYKDDVYKFDEIVMKGFKLRPPVYYDKIFSDLDPEGFVTVKDRRHEAGVEFNISQLEPFFDGDQFDFHGYAARLRSRDIIAKQEIFVKRSLEKL